MKKVIQAVEAGSIGEEMGIEAGDVLLAINDLEIVDIFDYRLAVMEEELEILIQKPGGEQWLLELEKDEDEELGLVFEGEGLALGLMDNMRNCGNKCIFCFIDQNPPHMRPGLYVKDDDYRLSFLHGNYITLTNMHQKDIDRILRHRISPVNISIHATDPDLRIKMMGNKRAGAALDFLGKLAEGGIVLALQIVLCKGYNDGEHLDKTIDELARYIPDGGGGCSLSIVPVGITKYRQGLTHLEPFNQQDCLDVIATVNRWQEKLKAEKGTRFVFAADEFYLKAGVNTPSVDEYEDFPQIDNGVGMLTAFADEFEKPAKTKKATLVTGVAAAPFMQDLLAGLAVDVVAIHNNFYGENITVAGLLTGRDIIKQLTGRELGEVVLIPKTALKADENVFLDDIALDEMATKIGRPVIVVETTGYALARALKG
ncbi:MAG: DUF512 domain-containing protein [Defluviitaleaceae bacterium]|nr:DUF512 domain-containing protein [Defluviitaleaceae bacterium]